MEYLPGLAPDQKEFADTLYPIFDDLKSSALMIAGIVLLLEEDRALSSDLQASIKKISAELNQNIRLWESYEPSKNLQKDYALVQDAFIMIAETIEELLQAAPIVSEELVGSMTTDLLVAYQQLRAIALDYWRLELVAESGHLHHNHAG